MSEESGIWVGEWIGKDPIVVFDPAAQVKPGVVVTYYSVAKKEIFHLLPRKAAELIRRLGDAASHPEAIARYDAWRATQRPKGKRAAAAPGSRRTVVNLPAHVKVVIPAEVFQADWAAFSAIFPGTFESPKYRAEERDYKVGAHERIRHELNAESFGSLREDELVTRVQRAFAATDNLVYRVEHAALHGALQVASPERTRWLHALGDLLWKTEEPLETRFTAWLEALEGLPSQGKTTPFHWPVATALPYLAQPETHCILKPTNAQAICKRYGFDLGYTPQPNYVTYQRWLCFVEALSEQLMERGARDRLDVQSFLWRTAPQSR